MSSTAVSAQGTKFQVETAASAALTITGITKAAKAVVTATNTLAVGDVVVFAAVTGMTEINGEIGIVTAATGTTFTVAIDSTNFSTYASGGTATPKTFTSVGGMNTYSGFDGQASEIDVTDMDSTAKEFRLGLQDFGNLNINLKAVLPTDPGQLAIRAAKTAGTLLIYRIKNSDGQTIACQGYAKKFTEDSGVDKVRSGQITLRLTGTVRYS